MDFEGTPGPTTYVQMTLRSWWDNLPLVLLAGFVFVGVSAPALALFFLALFGPVILVVALTVVPAWVALLAQLADIAREVKTNIGVMFKSLVRYWARSAVLGLLVAFPAVMFMLALPALGREQVPVFVWVSFAVDGLVALLLLALLVYAGPLLVIHDLSIRDALRNGLILSARYPMNTLGIMGMVVIFVFATIRVHSLLIFLWPALWGLFVVNNCRMVVSQELAQNAD